MPPAPGTGRNVSGWNPPPRGSEERRRGDARPPRTSRARGAGGHSRPGKPHRGRMQAPLLSPPSIAPRARPYRVCGRFLIRRHPRLCTAVRGNKRRLVGRCRRCRAQRRALRTARGAPCRRPRRGFAVPDGDFAWTPTWARPRPCPHRRHPRAGAREERDQLRRLGQETVPGRETVPATESGKDGRRALISLRRIREPAPFPALPPARSSRTCGRRRRRAARCRRSAGRR